MSIEVKIDRDAGLLIWRFGGRLEPADILAAIEKVGVSPDFDRTLDELIVMDETVQMHAYDAESLQKTQKTIKAAYGDAAVRNVRSAVVCPTEEARSIIKLWRALAIADEEVGLNIRIFSDEKAARAWLEAPLD